MDKMEQEVYQDLQDLQGNGDPEESEDLLVHKDPLESLEHLEAEVCQDLMALLDLRVRRETEV